MESACNVLNVKIAAENCWPAAAIPRVDHNWHMPPSWEPSLRELESKIEFDASTEFVDWARQVVLTFKVNCEQTRARLRPFKLVEDVRTCRKELATCEWMLNVQLLARESVGTANPIEREARTRTAFGPRRSERSDNGNFDQVEKRQRGRLAGSQDGLHAGLSGFLPVEPVMHGSCMHIDDPRNLGSGIPRFSAEMVEPFESGLLIVHINPPRKRSTRGVRCRGAVSA
jgi:hypothetical protein